MKKNILIIFKRDFDPPLREMYIYIGVNQLEETEKKENI